MSNYQTKNYTAHGGAETVIGGKLTFLAGATVEGLTDLIAPAVATAVEASITHPVAAAVADSEATTIAALKENFNALLAALRTAGLLATETADAGDGDVNAGGEGA